MRDKDKALGQLVHRLDVGRENRAGAFTKANSVPCTLAVASHNHLIAILDELSALPVANIDRLCSTPCNLKHRAVAPRRRARDGARAQQVARLHRAAGDGVVCKLLLHRPVHVLEVAVGYHGSFLARRLDCGGQVNVKVVRVLVRQVRQRGRVLRDVWGQERLQCIHGHDPR